MCIARHDVLAALMLPCCWPLQWEYTGIAYKSCGAVWAGVVVGDRIGFVKAKDLGYCSRDSRKCIIAGQGCKADWLGGGAACCSAVCNSWTGAVVFKFGAMQVPWKVRATNAKWLPLEDTGFYF